MSERRRIKVVKTGDLTTVSFNDMKIVDSAHVEEMYGELCSLVDTDGTQHIMLNFEGVAFLSSAALNKLVLLNKKVKQVDGRLRLCNLRTELLEIFTITRLDRVFNIRRSCRDDDDLESWGAWVPKPTPPDNLDGRVERRTD